MDFQEEMFANTGTLLSLGLQSSSDIQHIAKFIGGREKQHQIEAAIRDLDQFDAILFNKHHDDPFERIRIKAYFERGFEG